MNAIQAWGVLNIALGAANFYILALSNGTWINAASGVVGILCGSYCLFQPTQVE